MLEAVPELADGGFWYHVADSPTIFRGKTIHRPELPPGSSFAGVDLSDGSFVVRIPTPLLGVSSLTASSGRALVADGYSVRPPGLRVGGR